MTAPAPLLPSLRVYISGAHKERIEVRRYMQAVKDAGMVLEDDWTLMGEDAWKSQYKDRQLAATLSGIAVLRSNVYWLMAPIYHSASRAWYEFGLASAKPDRHIIVSGEGARFVTYAALPGVVVKKRHEEALEFLVRVNNATRAGTTYAIQHRWDVAMVTSRLGGASSRDPAEFLHAHGRRRA